MSAEWQRLPKYPTIWPSRKTGVTTVKSLSWPEVIQGSLVISTSPGPRVSGEYAASKWRTPVAIGLICPGVPVSDCAIIWPRVSKTPQARSCDSRTTVLKAVRISAACCSLATERSRFQRTSSVTGSRVVAVTGSACDVSAVMRSLDLYCEISFAIDRDRRPRADDGRRFALLDDRGANERRPRSQPVAIVDRNVGHPTLLRHIGA